MRAAATSFTKCWYISFIFQQNIELWSSLESSPQDDSKEHHISSSPEEASQNLEILYIFFFMTDIDRWEVPASESAGWTSVTLERFEKFKMAPKIAVISCHLYLYYLFGGIFVRIDDEIMCPEPK